MATSTTTTSSAAAAALFFSQKPGLMMLTSIQPQARWRPPPPPISQRLHLHQITVSCSAESAASKSTNQKSDSNERNSSADEEDASGYRSRRQQQQGRDSSGQRPDTRIHWGTSTEGWIGLEDSALPSSSSSSSAASGGGGDDEGGGRNSSSGRRRPGFLAAAPDSHYQYLGVSADAELEEIKAAYRRLSKEYHPDSTSLPLEVAAEKFLRLKKAYDVLSSEEERRLYDWQLAQMYSSVQGGRFIWPYEADRTQRGYGSRPPPTVRREPVNADTLGGRNMPLSGQAQTALAFDVFALFVSLLAILYASFFKQPPGQ